MLVSVPGIGDVEFPDGTPLPDVEKEIYKKWPHLAQAPGVGNPAHTAEDYFRDNFNTPLTPEQEQDYGAWAAAQSRTRGFDIGDAHDYDMRGYWKNADPAELNARQGHFTDTYKKPNHPTFSKESQYNGTPNELTGGTWQGGVWGDRTFTPSPEMLQTHPINWLQNYMRKVEPDSKLVLPSVPSDTPEPTLGELSSRALERGVALGKSDVLETGAVGLQVAKGPRDALGGGPGFLEEAQTGLRQQAKELRSEAPPPATSIDTMDWSSPSAIGRYALERTIENAPFFAPVAAAGAAGFLMGGPPGAIIGAGLATAGMEIGSTQQQLTEAGKGEHPLAAIGAGLAKGAIEVVEIPSLMAGFGLAKPIATKLVGRVGEYLSQGNRLTRTAKGGFAYGLTEGGEEALQTATDQAVLSVYDENKDLFSPEKAKAILEDSVAAFFPGMVMGMVAGGLHKRGPVAPPALSASTPEVPGSVPPTTEDALSGENLTNIVEETHPQQRNLMDEPSTLHVKPIAPARSAPRASDKVLEALHKVGKSGAASFEQARAELPDMSPEEFNAGVLDLREQHGQGIMFEADRRLSAQDARGQANYVEDPKNKALAYDFPAVYTGLNLDNLPRGAEAAPQDPVRDAPWRLTPAELARASTRSVEPRLLENATEQVHVPPGTLTGDELQLTMGLPVGQVRLDSHVRDDGPQTTPIQGIEAHEHDLWRPLNPLPVGNFEVLAPRSELGEEPAQRVIAPERSALLPLPSAAPLLVEGDVTPEARQGLRRASELWASSPDEAAKLLLDLTNQYDLKYNLPKGFRPGGFIYTKGIRTVDLAPSSFASEGTPDGLWSGKAVQDFAQKAEGWLAEDGNKWKGYGAMAPGSVQLVRPKGASPISSTQWQAAKIIHAAIRKFLPNVKVTISQENALGRSLPQGIDAYTARLGPNEFHLDLTAVKAQDPLHLFSVVSHEVGHMLRFTSWKGAEPHVRAKVLRVYQRWRLGSQGGTRREAILGRDTLYDIVTRLENVGPLSKVHKPVLETLNADDADYFYSFDEWFAQQMARWFDKHFKPHGAVQGFFHKVARQYEAFLRNAWGRLGLKADQFDPERAIEEYVHSVYKQREARGPSALAEANRDISRTPTGPPEELIPTIKLAKQLDVKLNPELEKDTYGPVIRRAWFLLHIIKANVHVPGVPEYGEANEGFSATAWHGVVRAETRIREMQNLGKEMDPLGRALIGYDAQEFLAPGEKPRLFRNNAELIAFLKRFNLSKEGIRLFARVVGDFRDYLGELESELVKRAARQFKLGDPQYDAVVKRLEEDFARLKSVPYFPRSRFGDWVVTVRDRQGKLVHMESFESLAEQWLGLRRLKSDARFRGLMFAREKIPESVQTLRGLPASAIEALAQAQLAEPGVMRESLLDVLLFEASTQGAFRHHFRRRGPDVVSGYSQDALRNYADYFFHGSKHLARLRYGDALQSAVDKLEKHLKDLRSSAPTDNIDMNRRWQIFDHLNRHMSHLSNPKNDLPGLRAFIFHMKLTFNPRAAFIQGTSIPATTYPYLARHYGDVGAVAATLKATKDIGGIYKASKASARSPFDVDFNDAIGVAMDEGFIAESLAMEMAGLADGGLAYRFMPRSSIHRKMRQFNYWGASGFQFMEKVNRLITFKAAWDLAPRMTPEYREQLTKLNPNQITDLITEKGWSRDKALRYLAAKDAVRETQGEYARWNRPEILRGVGAAVLMFETWNLVWLHIMRHEGGMLRTLAVLVAMGGLMALPEAKDIRALIRLTYRKLLGKDFDPELEIRKLLVEAGSEHPDVYLYGSSRYGFGLPWLLRSVGIPAPDFDVTGSVGYGALVPGVEALGSPVGSFEDKFTRATTDAAGAVFSLPIDMLQALASDNPDQFQRWQRVMPTYAAAAGRAYAYASEGMATRYGGKKVIGFDMTDPLHVAEIVGVAMGLPPTRLTQARDESWAEREYQAATSLRRHSIYELFAQGKEMRRPELTQEAMRLREEFNKEMPLKQRLSYGDLQRSLRERQAGDKRAAREAPLHGAFPEVQH